MDPKSVQFLNFGTTDILGQTLLCHGSCPVHSGSVAVPLAPTHWIPLASLPKSHCDDEKMPSLGPTAEFPGPVQNGNVGSLFK